MRYNAGGIDEMQDYVLMHTANAVYCVIRRVRPTNSKYAARKGLIV